MNPEDVVWPWCLNKFKGSWMVKDEIVGNLRSRYYDTYSSLTTTRPPKKVIEGVSKIMCNLNDTIKKKELPMAVIISNSSTLLGSIAKLMAIAWPLTFHGSSNLVDTTELMKLFRIQHDEFEQEIAFNTIKDFKTCGFLFWERIDMEVIGTKRQGGQFATLLADRVVAKLPTIFSAAYTAWRANFRRDLIKQVDIMFGPSVASVLQETASVMKLELEAPTATYINFKI